MNLNKRAVIAIALFGILVEVVVLVLLAQKRIASNYATPLMIAGMFLAFVPMFVVARRARRR